ncbi:GGDEF domain-containing protein [Leucobacter massiliensis]|uniref:GGDEF domain-containing protein n=1 Tax=Leucobacter massiliensis TaxID=1686285 RepID=A0A2S9QP90_9MICO|nr:GGDEF domain-containing protein [Leucobacter massiliensis]PRI11404.1 hypothetical protein B4915_06065 [Leucobacter massiliensis]
MSTERTPASTQSPRRPARRSADAAPPEAMDRAPDEVAWRPAPAAEAGGADAFTRAAEQVVAYLNAHTPLTDWSVSRAVGGEQIHLHVHRDQLLSRGDRFAWSDTFCSRMASGAAHVVRDSRKDPGYADLRLAEHVGAYAGYTITDDRDEMFGVLCGVRRDPLRAAERVDEPLLRLLSELLSSQLRLARGFDRERRNHRLAHALAQTDALTGALNRRGWERLAADAQERLDSFGDPVAVGIVDLDGLKAVNDAAGHASGDALIRRAAQALIGACTPAYRVARYGGDEFVILANGVTRSGVEACTTMFAEALARAGVAASTGFAAAEPGRVSIERALAAADSLMYRRKRERDLPR